MTTTRNKHIAPAVLLAAALIGAGAAYAATKLHRSSAGAAALSAAVNGTPIASGSAGTARDDGHGPGGRGFGHGGDELTAAANYLGLTESALATQLEAGKTLAQVAGATSGKSVAGLVDALVAAEKTEIAAAVTAGRLTQAQADQVLPTLQARFTALVNNAFVDAGLLVDARRPLKVTIFNGYHSQLAVDTSPQLHCTVINTTHRKPRSRANRRQPFSYSAILASTALQDITAPLLPCGGDYIGRSTVSTT